nr:hypothetical protein [Mesorhizobium sp. Mes31]
MHAVRPPISSSSSQTGAQSSKIFEIMAISTGSNLLPSSVADLACYCEPPFERLRQDSIDCQAPEHSINLHRRRFRTPIEPPGQHGHIGANDILDDEFARGGLLGAGGCGKFTAHQIRQYLANAAKADGAAATAGQGPVQFQMVARVFEHDQAEGQASAVARRRNGLSLLVGEQ